MRSLTGRETQRRTHIEARVTTGTSLQTVSRESAENLSRIVDIPSKSRSALSCNRGSGRKEWVRFVGERRHVWDAIRVVNRYLCRGRQQMLSRESLRQYSFVMRLALLTNLGGSRREPSGPTGYHLSAGVNI